MNTPLVYITGASSGLGQALARRFKQEGYRLALVARRTQDMTRWVQAQGWSHDMVCVYGADVCDVRSITQAGQHCIEQQGLPDVVIASAGISVGVDTTFFEDIEVVRRTFETNNIGMFATFQPFIAPMREHKKGTLVGIASVAGIRGLPGHGAYCASKAAVISYLESLRGELRDGAIKVVTLLPGYIDTPLTQENRYSMPFLMQPDDFAHQAFKAIQKGVSYKTIPWPMGVVAQLMRWLPNALFDQLLQGRQRKHRQAE
jgi:short-subunit dehydrogenase